MSGALIGSQMVTHFTSAFNFYMKIVFPIVPLYSSLVNTFAVVFSYERGFLICAGEGKNLFSDDSLALNRRLHGAIDLKGGLLW